MAFATALRENTQEKACSRRLFEIFWESLASTLKIRYDTPAPALPSTASRQILTRYWQIRKSVKEDHP
jgi:hypothetical protein